MQHTALWKTKAIKNKGCRGRIPRWFQGGAQPAIAGVEGGLSPHSEARMRLFYLGKIHIFSITKEGVEKVMLTKAPKGTHDVLPEQSYTWQYVEKIIAEICENYGYKEIRTPVFEHTELFARGMGETTDVVQKEMYTFTDKGNRSITLRPEGTAPSVRSYIENSLYAMPQPVKMRYVTSCYRYERPQAGRLREFHQFGVEALGTDKPSLDAEIVSLAMELLSRLGIKGLSLNINSIGCPKCRQAYNERLKEYIKPYVDTLCMVCVERYEKNPLRILDCKVDKRHEGIKNAPILLNYICDSCRQHFELFKAYLDNMHIAYQIDVGIVRGLDYYTKTVFEIVSEDIGAQSTVCGGGRYDKLVEQLGGPSTPAIGFGLGLERLLLTMEAQGIQIPKPTPIKLFIAHIGEIADMKAQSLVYMLRKQGISADKDHMGKSVKAQMKYANKLGVQYTMVLGQDEIDTGKAVLKEMESGQTQTIELKQLVNSFKDFGKLDS